MATKAHCAYCFETLTANLEKRPALSLQQVEDLWAKYTASSTAPSNDDAADDEDADDSSVPDTSSPRPAAISRLLAPSPSSASTSSSSVQSAGSSPAGPSTSTSLTSSSTSLAGPAAPSKTPLFVTWNTTARPDGTPLPEKRLRGCIGTFEAQELDRGLAQYAVISALQDTRFPPISSRELPALSVGVTLLTDFEPAADAFDWTVGTHGLRISFTHKGRKYASTYLPDVAREQGWSKEETVVSLMRKAGWGGRREEWRGVELGVVRYQGRKVDLEWGEWRGWREWVDGEEK